MLSLFRIALGGLLRVNSLAMTVLIGSGGAGGGIGNDPKAYFFPAAILLYSSGVKRFIFGNT